MEDPPKPPRQPDGVIVPFRPRPRRSGGVGESRPVRGPISNRTRFVYDVKPLPGGFAVTFDGAVITRHETQDLALKNARLIASNFWSEGIPTLVRVVTPDGIIQPIVSFG